MVCNKLVHAKFCIGPPNFPFLILYFYFSTVLKMHFGELGHSIHPRKTNP